MADEDYSFYNDQKGRRIAKCLDVPLPLTSSDIQFIRRLQVKPNFAISSACPSEIEIDSAANNVSESESTCPYFFQSLTTFEFVVGSSNIPVSSWNRKRWSNIARMCERYQLSDRAAAAIANCVLVDVGKIMEDDKTSVIDCSKLRRAREDAVKKFKKRINKTLGL